MIRITALNEIINYENEDDTLTKEVQEQIALNEYNQALELIIKNKSRDALHVLKELLTTELLDEIKKPEIQDGCSRPMLSLKYACFKNIGNIHIKMKNYHDALYYYWEALQLDKSDVMLWYKIGTAAIKIHNLDLACLAFKHGLKRNPNHWPCLDKIITVLYAIPDYMNCLLYISVALQKDPTYVKGLSICQVIFKNISRFQELYKIYNHYWAKDLLFSINYNKKTELTLSSKDNEFIKSWIHKSTSQIKKKVLITLPLKKSLKEYTWLELGKSLIDMYKYIDDNNLNFLSQIILDSDLSNSMSPNNKIFTDKQLSCNADNVVNALLSTNSYLNDCGKIVTDNLRKDSLFQVKQDNNLMKSDEQRNQNKFSTNIIPFVEENTTKNSLNENYICDGRTNDSNIQIKEEKSFIHTKKISDNLLHEKTNDYLSSEYSNKSSCIQNHKNFESDEINKFNEKEKYQKVKKRRRSSLCFLTQWAWSNSNTKRSSRNRTYNRKDYERDGVILEETLKQIFPSYFLLDNAKIITDYMKSNEDSLDTIDLYYAFANERHPTDEAKSAESSKPTSPVYEYKVKYFGTEQENYAVNEFINEHNGKNNLIVIISNFIGHLSTKWNSEWPNELSEIFIQSYLIVREHMSYPSPLNAKIDDSELKLNEEATLLFCELYTDKWLITNLDISYESKKLEIGILSDDLGSIVFNDNEIDLQSKDDALFLLRLLWLKSILYLYLGDSDISLKSLELLLHHMGQIDTWKPSFRLPNCKYNYIIDMKTVQKMLKSIQRSKKFSEIKNLHHEQQYDELARILKDAFDFSKQPNQSIFCKELLIDRVEYFQVLLDSLWQLQQYEDCYVWAEACLNESWQNYLQNIGNSIDNENRNKWTRSILYTLEKLNACVTQTSSFVVKHLSEYRKSRFVQNLVYIVCHQLDVLDNTTVMPIESILPWILLHSVLQYEEDKQRAKSSLTFRSKSYTSIHSDEDDDEEDIPASIKILFKAHDFLGRHGWCCVNNGNLLIFIMKLLIPNLYFPMYLRVKHKLKVPLEQIIYCLYGYPTKFNNGIRAKPKYLDEHVKSHINLTWETCQLLFEFYKPENLPTFESKRVDSINSDIVNLFKKICLLVPHDSDPTKLGEEMNAYLLGNKKEMPVVKKSFDDKISYVYYLIADHYFKAASNNSWSNAIKYYTLDLCLHPKEVNSWAGLAMSTSTMMETWLNNFLPNINEEKYLSKAKIAQKSYQHAVDLSPSHLTIWTEFGNFLYTVHSFCSRLLKQESDSLNMERFRILEARKDEMLDEAKNCFISANHIYTACQGVDEPQDERWLYQYMLGKIAEKKNEDPPIFLKHYSKASELLHLNNAQYPKRISHKNSQNLAIEALEVYYRIHASILKYLEQHEGKLLKQSLAQIFEHNLKNCMLSPFINHSATFKNSPKEQSNDTRKEKSILDRNKSDSRKRCNDEPILVNETKRVKLSSVSHLQLMQDVVAVIDDLITKVCHSVLYQQMDIKQESKEKKSFLNFDISISNKKKTVEGNCQHFKDNSNDNIIELRLEKDQYTVDDEYFKTSDKKWILNEDLKEENLKRNEETKSCNNPEGTLYRRGSQGSSSTTKTSTTETNNSTTSSSEDSSSSDDSSDSSSSSESDSDSVESDLEKRKIIPPDEDVYMTAAEVIKLTEYCLAGLEQCVIRFPEHYKSIYRLAYFFFNNKYSKDIIKSKQLLLGNYKCQFYPNETIQGLFVERKNVNFFNGIWRIPVHEIDRPGSFSSHMSRCILLLMQVLKETSDSRMLTELCLQLRKTPDTDKKYLRDDEREQLACQALTLCLQCLRNKIKNANIQNSSLKMYASSNNDQMQLLLDIYYVYQNIKNIQEYENLELPKAQRLLEDAYTSYISDSHNIQGNIFEQAKEYCRQRIRATKLGSASIDPNIQIRTLMPNSASQATNIIPCDSTNKSCNVQNRKSQKVAIGGRPRGRPPGINKFSQIISSNTVPANSHYDYKYPSANNTDITNINNPSGTSCNLSSFLNSNMLSAVLNPHFNTKVTDSSTNHFQVGIYPDIFQKYQNNINNISKFINYSKNVSNVLNNETTNNESTANINFNITKDNSDISIIPVTNHMHQLNSKDVNKGYLLNNVRNQYTSKTMPLSKSVQIHPQLSVLKSSQFQHHELQQLEDKLTNTLNPVSAGSNTAEASIFQTHQTKIGKINTNEYSSQPSVSLQHKLLSKKHGLRFHQTTNTANRVKKLKQNKSFFLNSPTDLLSCVTSSGIPKSFNTVTVTAVSSNTIKQSYNLQTTNKFKASKIEKIPASFTRTSSSPNALSVLSQLQQHSHLEIIPQTKNAKDNIDLISISKRPMGLQNTSESMNLTNKDSISVYELPGCKVMNDFIGTPQERKDKCEKSNVEIITLDD